MNAKGCVFAYFNIVTARFELDAVIVFWFDIDNDDFRIGRVSFNGERKGGGLDALEAVAGCRL